MSDEPLRFDNSRSQHGFGGTMSDQARVEATEADYEDGVRCVVMPCCGFTFDAGHTDDRVEPPRYTCPLCRPSALAAADAVQERPVHEAMLTAQLAEAHAEIRRLRAQPADDQRMVDRETFVAEVERVLRERAETFVSRRTRVAFFMAAEVVQDVFGGPASSEEGERR